MGVGGGGGGGGSLRVGGGGGGGGGGGVLVDIMVSLWSRGAAVGRLEGLMRPNLF